MNEILNKILEAHTDDKEQLEVIKTDKKRLIIEAPAGYGKTKTMISQIAYLVSSQNLPNPKKILALTFSVNAAYKIRKDIASSALEGLPPHFLRDKIFATNYHGFCRRFLSLYGCILDERFRNVRNFTSIEDNNVEFLQRTIGLNLDTSNFLTDFNDAVKNINEKFIKDNFKKYNNYVIKHLMTKKYITFNSILTFTIQLLSENKNLKKFFQSLYPIIIIDEFQDTNILSWQLLNILIDQETRLYLYGDSLQRIYGFIGAIPNLMEEAQKKFNACKIEFKTNYRFKDNKEMLLLDRNIRNIAKDINSHFSENATLTFYLAEDQTKEAELIYNLSNNLLNKNPNTKIAILVRQRGKNINKIIEIFKARKIDFFYALFSDEDEEYIKFHKDILNILLKLLIENSKERSRINKTLISKILYIYENKKNDKKNNELEQALIELFKVYWNKVVFGEFNFLEREEKIEFIKDTLENNGLKQYLGYVDHKIIITTVHGAKGLEWDYVILPDMEQYSFPNFLGLCSHCRYQQNCEVEWDNMICNEFYNELSVFYVAITRAKIKNIFTASSKRIDKKGNEEKANISCFLKLPGIRLNYK